MYKFKQDLAMAYFPDHSKESASKRFAHEIHSNKPLLAALQATHYLHPPFLVHPSGKIAAAIPLPSSPKKKFSNKHLTISLIQRLPKKIFNFCVTFSYFCD